MAKDIQFKDISIFSSGGHFCSVELNCLINGGHHEEFRSVVPMSFRDIFHLCSFGPGHYEVQFCEIILNLDQWFRCCLKTFLI